LDRETLKSQQLRQLASELTGKDPDKASEAFESLCLRFRPEEVEEISGMLLEKGSRRAVFWLVRYLGRVGSRTAADQLVLLARSSDPAWRAEARSGLLKLGEDSRIKALLELLDAPAEDIVLFAVRQLGDLGQKAATMTLLTLYETGSGKVKREVLRALGRIGDRRSLAGLEKIVRREEGELRNEAILALSRFALSLRGRFLKRCVFSENAETRKSTYLTLVRLKSRRWEKWIAAGLLKETDADVKSQILSELRTVQHPRLFKALIRLASNDRSGKVRMLVHTVFRRIRSERILGWLLAEERRARPEVRERVLRALAIYAGEVRVFRVYRKNALQEKYPRLKLAAIEYLGYTRRKEVMPLLERMVLSGNPYSYVAAVALTHLLDRRNWDLITRMLELPEERHAAVVQLFLRFVSRISQSGDVPGAVKDALGRHARSERRNVRYLALRCLSHLKAEGHFDALIAALSEERDPLIRRACREGLSGFVKDDPRLLIPKIGRLFEDRRAITTFEWLIGRAPWGREDFRKVLCAILAAAGRTQADPACGTLPFLRLFRALTAGRAALLMRVFQEGGFSAGEERILMRLLAASELADLPGLSVDFMAGRFTAASLETRLFYLDFFGLMKADSPEVRRRVFESLKDEEDPVLREKIRRTVRRWLEQSLEGSYG